MTAAPEYPLTMSQQLLAVARDIKLSHTVFALPFALLATFLSAGSDGRLPTVLDFVFILLCMATARTFAMVFNRWADRKIDAANPRTVRRAVASGRVDTKTAWLVLACCAVLMGLFTLYFLLSADNPWPLILTPAVLLVLAGYSYTKRFTWLCHVFLGFALALSPIAAAIAIEPGYLSQPTLWLLALMVLSWVAGFDILYALQDTEVDRELGLYSIPSRLGISGALWISRALHVLSAGALAGVTVVSDQLATLFAITAVLTVCLLIVEHALVWGGRTKQLNMAFFTVNGVISLMLGGAGIVDVLRSV